MHYYINNCSSWQKAGCSSCLHPYCMRPTFHFKAGAPPPASLLTQTTNEEPTSEAVCSDTHHAHHTRRHQQPLSSLPAPPAECLANETKTECGERLRPHLKKGFRLNTLAVCFQFDQSIPTTHSCIFSSRISAADFVATTSSCMSASPGGFCSGRHGCVLSARRAALGVGAPLSSACAAPFLRKGSRVPLTLTESCAHAGSPPLSTKATTDKYLNA